jgi:site-specific DNA recombinase
VARVLGRIRLSKLTDESTSEDRQRKLITDYCDNNGHELVGIAVDLDVSGSVSPFETPEFGAWLRDPESFDIIVSWKLDRLGRGLFDLNDLFRYCRDKGKTLVCTADQIDLSTPIGRAVSTLLAALAEMELENIKTRNAASREHARRNGRYHGGSVEYGYRAVELPGGGYGYAIDETAAAVVRDIFDRVEARQSVNSITNMLTENGVPTARGGKWSTATIFSMLRSQWVLGRVTYNDRVVTDESGLPVQRAEPLVTLAQWQRVQAVLSDNSRPRINVNEKGMLLGVLRCGECSAPMYLHVLAKTDRKPVYRYWRCSAKSKRKSECANKGVPADLIESHVADTFLRQVGHIERTVKVFVPASGAGEELDGVNDAIATVRKERDLGFYDGDDDGYFQRLSVLIERRKTLSSVPSLPARWESQGTGETYAAAWERMNGIERRELLIDAGVTATADMNASPRFSVSIEIAKTAATVPGYAFDRDNVPANTRLETEWKRVDDTLAL